MYNPYQEITQQVRNLNITPTAVSNQNNVHQSTYNPAQTQQMQGHHTRMPLGSSSEYQQGYDPRNMSTSQYHHQFPQGFNRQSFNYSDSREEEQVPNVERSGYQRPAWETFQNDSPLYRKDMPNGYQHQSTVLPPNSISSQENTNRYQPGQSTQQPNTPERQLQQEYQGIPQFEKAKWQNYQIQPGYGQSSTQSIQSDTQRHALEPQRFPGQTQPVAQTQYNNEQVSSSNIRSYNEQTQQREDQYGRYPPTTLYQREERQSIDQQQSNYPQQMGQRYNMIPPQTGIQNMHGYAISNASPSQAAQITTGGSINNSAFRQQQGYSDYRRYSSEQIQPLPERQVHFNRDTENGKVRNDHKAYGNSDNSQHNKMNNFATTNNKVFGSYNESTNSTYPTKESQRNQHQINYSNQQNYTQNQSQGAPTGSRQPVPQNQQTMESRARSFSDNFFDPNEVPTQCTMQGNALPNVHFSLPQQVRQDYVPQNANYYSGMNQESRGAGTATDKSITRLTNQQTAQQNPAYNAAMPLSQHRPGSDSMPVYPAIYGQQQYQGNPPVEAVPGKPLYEVGGQRIQDQNAYQTSKNFPMTSRYDQDANDRARMNREHWHQQKQEQLPAKPSDISTIAYPERNGNFNAPQNIPNQHRDLTSSFSQESETSSKYDKINSQNIGHYSPQQSSFPTQTYNRQLSNNSSQLVLNQTTDNQPRHPMVSSNQPGIPITAPNQPGNPFQNASRYSQVNSSPTGQRMASIYQSGQPVENFSQRRAPVANVSQSNNTAVNANPIDNASQSGYPLRVAYQSGYPMVSASQPRNPFAYAQQVANNQPRPPAAMSSQSRYPMMNNNQPGKPMVNTNEYGHSVEISGQRGRPMSNSSQPGPPMERSFQPRHPMANSSPNQHGHAMPQQTSQPGQPIVIMPGLSGSSHSSRPASANFEPKLQMILEAIGHKQGPTYAKLRKIAEDVLGFQNEIMNFTGRRGDKDYIIIEEMLTRQLLSLDAIPADGLEDVRLTRRSIVRQVQGLIQNLERRAKT